MRLNRLLKNGKSGRKNATEMKNKTPDEISANERRLAEVAARSKQQGVNERG